MPPEVVTEANAPESAMIPQHECGIFAVYGHPNAALLARLARGGARVLRTDQGGDLAAVATDRGLAVVARGDPPAR